MSMIKRTPRLGRQAAIGVVTAVAMMVTTAAASAETLLMPNRDYLRGVSQVAFGVTTLPNNGIGGIATTYAFDFNNDGIAEVSGNVTDRSYIAVNYTFPLAGTFTIKLTVTRGATVEEATGQIRVFDPTTAEELRAVNINRAIEDGLRYLWVNQSNRTGFDTLPQTTWGGFSRSFTALATLAFENHGYHLPNNNTTPTGLYEKYAVRRGINYIVDQLQQVNLTAQTAGDPCANVSDAPAPCVGLQQAFEHAGYATSLAALPLAGSNALSRVITEVPGSQNGGFVTGKTIGEILQRIMNAQAWGQGDPAGGANNGRGGWNYGFNDPNTTDGSTIGWNILALLDAGAAGTVIPAFVKDEYKNFAFARAIGNDGSYDYNADANPASTYLPNVARAGIGLQGLFYTGGTAADPFSVAAQNYINARWGGNALAGDYTATCGSNKMNKGCAYAMFNVFKGLKLLGITTLPGVNRPAGSVGDPDDWYADYVDWLLANQTNPNSTLGGNWATMSFSCCAGDNEVNAAIAELILAPVALIAPDPTKFSTVGLRQGNPLSTNPDTNPVNTPHTVTAHAESSGGAPIAGVTISFQVTGRNSATGSATTDATGTATFTYVDAGPSGSGGSDSIQAFIGQVGSNLASNTLTKNWIVPVNKCDTDGDNDVDSADLLIIRMANGQAASGAGDPRDGNGDGVINVADARYCQLRCTKPGCAQ